MRQGIFALFFVSLVGCGGLGGPDTTVSVNSGQTQTNNQDSLNGDTECNRECHLLPDGTTDAVLMCNGAAVSVENFLEAPADCASATTATGEFV